MATQLEYQQKIHAYDRKDLADLWKQIEERTTSDWELGKAFEYLQQTHYEQKILNR